MAWLCIGLWQNRIARHGACCPFWAVRGSAIGLTRGKRGGERAGLDLLRRDAAVSAQAVAIADADALMRDGEFEDSYRAMSSRVGLEGQRGVNAMSIADATGFAREPAWRKQKRLRERC